MLIELFNLGLYEFLQLLVAELEDRLREDDAHVDQGLDGEVAILQEALRWTTK